MLTLSTSIEAESRVRQLDLGLAGLDVPLLLWLVCESLPGYGVSCALFRRKSLCKVKGTYTTIVVPTLTGALGTMTNFLSTLEVMYTLR